MADAPKSNPAPLRSTLAGDPEMAELVTMFVSELADRRTAIASAMETRRVDDLKRLAHQLRGSSASYGLKPLGDVAGRLEDAIKQLQATDTQNLESVRTQVDELIEMCDRATG